MGNETNSPWMPQTCYNNPFFKYFQERVRNGVRNFIFSHPLCKNRGHNDLSCSDRCIRKNGTNSLTRNFVRCREIACNLQWQGNQLRFTGSRKLYLGRSPKYTAFFDSRFLLAHKRMRCWNVHLLKRDGCVKWSHDPMK